VHDAKALIAGCGEKLIDQIICIGKFNLILPKTLDAIENKSSSWEL